MNNLKNLSKGMNVREFQKMNAENAKKKIPIPDDNLYYISDTEYAERINIPRWQVQGMCRGGHIEGAKKIGNKWRIPIRRTAANTTNIIEGSEAK